MRNPSRLWPVFFCIGCIGCGGPLEPAVSAYEEARYPEAARQFRALEGAARAFDAREYADYALYRGLTHLALGDAVSAEHWIRRAKARVDRCPSLFDDGERGRLLAAWRSMGYMPGEPAVQ